MSKRRRGRGEAWLVAGFLAPNLIGFLVFTAGPVLFSLASSFTNWNLQGTIPFRLNGFENYSELASDPNFWLALVNTAYLMAGIPLAIAGSLFLAILLNQRLRGMVVFRTLFYLPSFTSGVALMILWKALYNPDFGPINYAVEQTAAALHVTPPKLEWLLSTRNLAGIEVERVGVTASQFGIGAREALILMGIWIAIGGNNMLLYLAALSNVPPELTEASEIDGANRWATFRCVVWPQLAPTTFFIVVMSFIGGLQGGFEQARVMTNGGPAGTTTTLAYFIYNKAFEEFRIGYASAVAWTLFALIFAITLANWKFGNRDEAYV